MTRDEAIKQARQLLKGRMPKGYGTLAWRNLPGRILDDAMSLDDGLSFGQVLIQHPDVPANVLRDLYTLAIQARMEQL